MTGPGYPKFGGPVLKRDGMDPLSMATRLESFSTLRRWLSGPRARSWGEGDGGAADDAIEPGALFAHVTSGRSVELARVIAIASDEFGIRHVRFHLAYRYQQKIMEAGERTLALASFRDRFNRRLEHVLD